MSSDPTPDYPGDYEPRYGSVVAVPLAGPESPLGPTVTDQPDSIGIEFGTAPTVQLSEEQKRAALYIAENRIDRTINDGDPISPEIVTPDVRDAANLYATYLLLLPSAHPATARAGETAGDSSSARLELAREYRSEAEEILAAFVLAAVVLLPQNTDSLASAVEALLMPLIFVGMGLLLFGIGMHLHLMHMNLVRQLRTEPDTDETSANRGGDS